MIIKSQKDVNPLLLRFGVALAISFAGFLYSRIRTKRATRPSLPPPPSRSSSSSDSYQHVKSEDGSGNTRADSNCGRDAPSSDAHEKPYLRIRLDKSSSSSSSPNNHSGGDRDRDSLLLPEFNNLVTDFNTSTTCDHLTVSILQSNMKTSPPSNNNNHDSPRIHENLEREGYLREIQSLRSKVRSLKEKERYLELQLLKYHGLKEQVSAVSELQSRLKIHNVESKLLALKIDSLQAENGRLKAQTSDYSKVVDELEEAKGKVKVLKRKLRSEAERNREQILSLKHKVAGMQLQEEHQQDDDEFKRMIDPDADLRLQKIEDLENEMEDLKKSNCDLQFENSQLARKLENAEIYASAVLNNPKIEELKSGAERLNEENMNLTREVERLHSVRCADVEELVYLRWLNACLRYELRNYEPPAGKRVARDLSRSLSPRSEKEAKRLILEYANTEEHHLDQSGAAADLTDLDYDNWFSSQYSNHTDSPEPDELLSSVDHNHHHHQQPNSGKPQQQKGKKKNVFSKLIKLVRGKQSSSSHSLSADSRSSTMESTCTTDEFDHRLPPPPPSSYNPHHSIPSEIDNAAAAENPSTPSRRTDDVLRSDSFVIEEVKDTNSLWTTPPPQQSSSVEPNNNRPVLTSLTEDAEMPENLSTSSPVSAASYLYRRRDSGGGGRESGFTTSPRGSHTTTDRLSDISSRKSDLAKYAEVLRDTSPSPLSNAQKGHRKAASLA